MVATSTSSARARPTIPHVEALDGLRGVAVIGVLLFHADHLAGGFLGVDLFFTLSGFLITSLLVVEHRASGRISLRSFWARRARRLLPAMLAVVAAATVVAALTLPDAEMERFGNQALLTLAYVVNWGEIASSRDYWALFDAPTPLEHVWSLAIEEQFYVVWPLLVLGSVRLLGRRFGIRVLVGIGLVASLATSWVVIEGAGGITRAYYGTDTRAASILVGAALATFTAGASRRPSALERGVAVGAVVSLGAILASWALVDGNEIWLYRYGFLAHALLTAVVIAAVSGPFGGSLGRALQARPLVRVGILSYGLYLWHWPVYVVLDDVRTGLDGWTLTALRLAVTLAIATASYHLLEAPIRSQRWRLPRPALVSVGAVALTAALVVVIAWQPGSAPDEIAPSDVASQDVARSRVTTASNGPPPSEPVTEGKLLVVGDSGPEAIADELVVAGRDRGLTVQVEAQVGCGLIGPRTEGVAGGIDGYPPDPEGCDAWPERWAGLVQEHEPDAVLLMLAWGGGGDRDLGDGVPRGPCDPIFDRYYRVQVRKALDVLSSSGAVVVVATTPPHAHEQGNLERTACLNQIYDESTRGFPSELLDFAAWTCAGGPCGTGPDERRPDGTHFAGAGAVAAAEWVIDETSRLTDLDGVPFVLVIGDSQALRMVEHAPPFNDIDLRVGSLAALGCGLSTQSVVMDGRATAKAECEPTLTGLSEDVAALEPDAVVVHAGVWEALDQVTEGGSVGFGDPRWETRLRANVAGTLRPLATAGNPLIALTTPCFGAGPGRDTFGTDDLDARVAAYNAVLVEEVERLGGEVVDFASWLCPDGVPVVELGGTVVRPDGVHLDRAGAQAVWPWLAEQLRAAVRGAEASPSPGKATPDS